MIVLNHSDSPRILISRLSAIGDTIYTLPVLNALRAHFPNSTLGWIVADHCSPVLRGHETLDELIAVDRRWLKSPRSVWQVRRHLRSLNFDITIDVQGLAKSAIPAWLSGAERRIGFTRGDREGREFSTWMNNEFVQTETPHVIDRNVALLQPLGIENPEIRFGVPEHTDEVEWVHDYLHRNNLDDRFVVINVGAAWLSKLWPTERFAKVAAYLADRYGLVAVLPWGNEQEREMAEGISSQLPDHTCVLPKMSLTQLGSLFRKAKLFLGSDTGPLHLAAAVGVQCIGLFGSTVVARHRPYGSQHIVLCHNYVDTGAIMRHADNSAMQLITVEEVCDACDQILSSAALVQKSAA